MTLATFIERSRSDWTRAEELIQRADRGLRALNYSELEDLAALHRRVVSSFAYARSHFPGTEIERRLRDLAFRGHRLLGKREKPLPKRLWRFFWAGFPRLFRASMPEVLASLGVFVGGILLGVVLSFVNPEFPAAMLGPDTVGKLQSGQIWTDEVSSSPALAVQLFTNNIGVMFTAWAGGVLFGLLTVFVMTYNGIHLGAIFGFVWLYRLDDRLFDWVSAHGPLELTLIVIAGGAGLMLARGLLTNSAEPRSVTLPRAGQRSVRLLIGLVPWMVLAGIVEGFISPIDSISTSVKLLIGTLVLLTFFVYVLACGRKRDEVAG